MGIFQNFRNIGGIRKLTNTPDRGIKSDYDEPTYLSFKVKFGVDANKLYNDVSNVTSYDFMPHPLLQRPNNASDYMYSAVTYLRNINEPKRADMLMEFIDMVNIIQEDYQWYFASIEGLDKLLDIKPSRGQRVSSENKLTIKCLDAIDRRMYYIFNLYKKIAWDDVYQRWILPDMMRFFTLTIYVTEFRHFHQAYNTTTRNFVSNKSNLTSASSNDKGKNFIKSVVSDIKDYATDFIRDSTPILNKNNSGFEPIALKMLDSVLPTHIINCEMCEFDIESFNTPQYANIDIRTIPEMVTFEFKVKVGKVIERYNYPIFERQIDDILINNNSRNVEPTIDEKTKNNLINFMVLENSVANDATYVPKNKRIHESGTYYATAKPNIQDPMTTSHTKDWINNNLMLSNTNIINNAINSTTSTATAIIGNMIEDTLTSLKMHEFMPGLSINSVQATLASGNVIGALGIVHNAINKTYDTNAINPSAQLDKLDVDNTFKLFLTEYSKATVSLQEEPLQNAAKKALMDSVYFERIKDYSKATDMLGADELNLYKVVINNNEIYNAQVNEKISTATDRPIEVYEGMPSSQKRK
ncbi:MAG: hypothetical protein ACRDD8_14235 [Bacteroidales bacterium]